MALQLGDAAPNFTAQTTEGTVDFHEYLGDGWGILFSHPADFTPVCTTELGAVARLKDAPARRNTKVIAVSAAPLDSPRALGQRYRGGHRPPMELPAERRPRARRAEPVRDDPSQCQQHHDRTLGLRDR